jgi:hypothetical protein
MLDVRRRQRRHQPADVVEHFVDDRVRAHVDVLVGRRRPGDVVARGRDP